MSRKKAQYTFLHANKKVHHDFFVGWRTDRRNRKIANQGKEEVVVTVTVADSFSDLDLVVEACELHPDEQR